MDLSFLLLVVLRICRDGTTSSIFLLFARCCYLIRQWGMQWCHLRIASLLMWCCLACHWCRRGKGLVLILTLVELRTLPLWCQTSPLQWQRSVFYQIESLLSMHSFFLWFHIGQACGLGGCGLLCQRPFEKSMMRQSVCCPVKIPCDIVDELH